MAGKPGSKRREYAPVAIDDLSGIMFADPAEAVALAPKTVGRTTQERTPVMLKLDEWCQESYNFWQKNGKPTPFSKEFPPVKIPTAKDKVDSVKFLARKSAQFVGHGIRFGTDNPTLDGRVMVSFCCTDKIPRKPRSGNGSNAS